MDRSFRRWPSALMRVGDAERRSVVEELQQHYVAGRLTADELGERVATALQARTSGDLAATLADLPELADQSATRVANKRGAERWSLAGAPLGALPIVVALVVILIIVVGGPLWWHWGSVSPLPLLFGVFFFAGWPRGGGRGRRD